ncbi:elongation of very long chain fatty acids protein 1-like isoform X2 [Diabrotica virgifera virgifera]|uniref:Elongation of very long chain fatty acids protein n=1 Tax=Diabrotica virgifera virgifera TaxID=50390 RepID=A0ABM5L097_DIAVI|nr:elongation of very long chain fatty acids protein 1-like isoform X2 [Diabrotica virgifera virgifera]
MTIISDIVNDLTGNIDPRHDGYITASPYFLWGFLLTYIFIIKVLGPKLMRFRQPYQIKNLLIGYNFIQILVNTFLVYEVFFILRKKYQQASFLHIYHHAGIVCAAFLAFRYDYGDAPMIVGSLNALTHVLMYIYYLLSAIDSRWSKYTTIKKSLTLLQIVQLNVILFSLTIAKLIPGCISVPTYSLLIWNLQNVFMINLFVRFYIKSYINGQKSVGKKN